MPRTHRCQTFALTGDASNTDLAWTPLPLHQQIFKLATTEASGNVDRFIYRNFNGNGGTPEADTDHDA